MTWRHDVHYSDCRGVWVWRLKVELGEVEVGDLYGMVDPERGLFRIERVIAVNCDETLTVQNT